MKKINSSSIWIVSLLVLTLLALLPGRSALTDEWTEISKEDARISLGASSLREASVYHAQQKITHGIAEFGSWEARAGRFPRAEVYAQILRHRVRYTSKFDLKDMTKNWKFLENKNLEFGSQNSYWNGLGQGKYRTFSFQGHECVAFRQYWGQVAETRGVDAGTRMLIGYYCNPSGVSLSEQAIDGILDSIRIRSDGELTVVTNTSKATENFDGTWILEIGETPNRSNRDRVKTIVKDGKFSASFETNGWRGQLVGEIDKDGMLNVRGSMKKIGLPSKFISFTTPSQGAKYEAETETFGGWGNTFFMISLIPESVVSGQ